MNTIARVTALFSGVARGGRSSYAADLAINFSFVLHESSSSAAVRRAVQASQRHSRARFQAQETVLDGDLGFAVDGWIGASVGLPDDLQSALREAELPDAGITFIDRQGGNLQPVMFFRGRAMLSLPTQATGIVGVAALVVRPGGASRQLIVRGPFDWGTERGAALQALEEIVQAHAEQWVPRSPLWALPAEKTFPDEFAE